MNGSLYMAVSILGLILVMEQIVESMNTLGKISSLVDQNYGKERNTRLYGEILALRSNLIDAYHYSYLECNDEKDTECNKKNESNYSKLESYLENIDNFLNENQNFKNLYLDENHVFIVKEHKQKNPALDNNYPNWYFRFKRRI